MGFTKDQVTIVKVLDHGDDRIEVQATVEGVYRPDAWDDVYSDDQYEEVDGQTVLKRDAVPSGQVLKADAELNVLNAIGWKSAMTNYFPPDAYDEEGNRDPDVEAREMTPAEKQDYCKDLILGMLPQSPAAPSEPVELDIFG